MISKGIGVLPGPHQSNIDHLVPLCQILEIPLLVTDRWILELIERYYPPMRLIFADPEDYNLDPYLDGYDFFLYVDFFRKATGSFHFHDYLCRHKVRSVMSLHGNPDKYWESYWLEKLNEEDIILAYGPQLVELLKKKGIVKSPIVTGNYRLQFYKQHEPFFDQMLPFHKEKKSLLYAPTWSAPGPISGYWEHYSPFLQVYQRVFEELAPHYQLIVKLHPQLIRLMPDEVARVREEFPTVYFLNDFPPIYPLLKQVDIYLGDYSSIGYDFLYFDRPLFFLETNVETALQKYGQRITCSDLPHLVSPSFPRHELYQQVYGKERELTAIKEEILHACGPTSDR